MTAEQIKRSAALEKATLEARKVLKTVHALPTTGLHGPGLEAALGDAAWAFFSLSCLYHEFACLNGNGDDATKKRADDLLSEAEFQLDELGIVPSEEQEPAPLQIPLQYLN